MSEPLDLGSRMADLRRVRLADLHALEGDSVLEATLRRLQEEAELKRESISGFSSAI